MKTMKEILPLAPAFFTEGEWGVEIEAEGHHLPDGSDLKKSIWKVEHDGSLKADEAYEYVMPKPKNLAGVREALDYLAERFDDLETTVDESIRAGVHVHMNVQDWSVKQMYTFITLYFLVEEVLVHWCGENREGNLFCLRSSDAEMILFELERSITTRNFKNLNNDDLRYCSLNVCSLFKYGSLEFRSMRGTGNLDAIYEWVEILEELRNSSKNFRDPADVILNMSGEVAYEWLRRIFPTKWKVLAADYQGLERTIRRAARRVQMLAFTVEWDKIGKVSNNPFAQEAF